MTDKTARLFHDRTGRLRHQEKDPQKQEHNVYEANNGNYYEKYAAMCGMIYLGQQWQSGAISRLKELFDLGYHGFAVKSAGL